MDASNAPKFFWYSLSVAILACTVMLLVIAYRSTDVSIRIANAKIDLKQNAAEVEKVNDQLLQENERIKTAQAELQRKYDKLLAAAGQERPITAAEIRKLDIQPFDIPEPTLSVQQFKDNRERLQRVMRRLD